MTKSGERRRLVPEEVKFAPLPQLAQVMLERAQAAGVAFFLGKWRYSLWQRPPFTGVVRRKLPSLCISSRLYRKSLD